MTDTREPCKNAASIGFPIRMLVFIVVAMVGGCRREFEFAETKPQPFTDPNRVIAELGDSITKGTTNSMIYLECGKAYLRKAEILRRRYWSLEEITDLLERATDLFSKGIALDTTSAELYHYHGFSLVQQSEAISSLEKARRLDSNNVSILTDLGLAYFGPSNVDTRWAYLGPARLNPWIGRAQEALEMAVRIDPNNAKAHRCLGDVYYVQWNYRKSFNEYQRALTLGFSDPEEYAKLYNLYPFSGEKAFKEDIEWIPIIAKLSFAPAMLFREGDAIARTEIQLLRRAVALDSNYVMALVNLMRLLAWNGEMERAIQCYFNLRAINPSLNLYDEKLLQAAIRSRPENYAPYVDLGNIYMWTRGPGSARTYDPESAIVQFRKAISLNPSAAAPYLHLWCYYLEKGDSTKASGLFKSALATKDSLAWTFPLLFELTYSMKRIEGAIRLANNFMRDPREKSAAYVLIGNGYLDNGDIKNAEKAYLGSLAYNNRNSDAEYGIGRVYAMSSNKTYLALLGCYIEAEDGFHLGLINADTLSPILKANSRFRQNESSLISRSNLNSAYGGPHGPLSPFNRRSKKPPKITRDRSFVAYLSDNPEIKPRISATRLLGFLSELSLRKGSK